MNRPYYIGFKDESSTKTLFLGAVESTWYSDFQSGRAFSKPEIKKVFKDIKRQNKDKKLKIIKISVTEL